MTQHLLDGAIAGERVQGRVDWVRRFDHMQQHTGQHVLSAAFEHLCGARTASFHLGSSSSTIDLSREVTEREIASAEGEANRIAREDRPVSVRFATEDDARGLPLRKEPARGGVLRLVEVEGFDLSACGGTHVARTGAIGLIAVASWERFRGGSRIEFLCGGRALAGYRALRDCVAGSVRLVSVLPSELPAGIERLQAEARQLKRSVKELQSRLAVFEADALVRRAEPIPAGRLVLASLEGWDVASLKAAATAVSEQGGHVAVLFSAPPPASVVVARARDVDVDASRLLQGITARFGGKGGGRPELAQGGGVHAPADALLEYVRARLREAAGA
jgi:alanyl-tRNA synthetase